MWPTPGICGPPLKKTFEKSKSTYKMMVISKKLIRKVMFLRRWRPRRESGQELYPTLHQLASAHQKMFTFSLNIPLFTGLQEIPGNPVKIHGLLHRLAVVRYSNLKTNKKRLISSKKDFDYTKESLRLTRLKYEAGITSLRELISVQKDLAKSKENQISAIAIYNLNMDNLERLTGLKASTNCYTNNALIKKDYIYSICNL